MWGIFKRNSFLIASILVVVGGLADAISTHICLSFGGYEANPLMAYVIQAGGTHSFYAIKLSFALILIALASWGKNLTMDKTVAFVGLFWLGLGIHNGLATLIHLKILPIV